MAEARRTAFALAAVEFADYFKEQFADLQIGASPPYQPSLTAPEGMSTGGGTQSIQHLTLKPIGRGGPPLTVGWVNRRAWTAQIRTFACLEEMHQQRFPGRRFDLDPIGYPAFVERAEAFLKGQGIIVQLETSPPAPTSMRPPAAASSGSIVVMIVGILVGFIGVAVALYVALNRK